MKKNVKERETRKGGERRKEGNKGGGGEERSVYEDDYACDGIPTSVRVGDGGYQRWRTKEPEFAGA